MLVLGILTLWPELLLVGVVYALILFSPRTKILSK